MLPTTHNSEVDTELRIRTSTLLKTDTVSFLLGAGASVDCGGPLIGKVPLALERALHSKGIPNGDGNYVSTWLLLFYAAAHCLNGRIPFSEEEILSRSRKLKNRSKDELEVNLEHLMALLYRWKLALVSDKTRLYTASSGSQVEVLAADLSLCLSSVKQELGCLCNLPTDDRKDGLKHFRLFLRKLLARPLNLKRINLFTLNYDTLLEQAADAEGIVLLDGFTGTHRRIFRPESYKQDLYFPGETTEGRVHRFDRVVHLCKLHGSVTWVANEPTIENPYGVSCHGIHPDSTEQMLVYPVPTKVNDTLGMPYAELFRRFSNTVVQPQSVLFVVGYGFGDDHVNAIIRQALAVPSFTLVIVDPEPNNQFMSDLRDQNDQRVWVFKGDTLGRFAKFVEHVLPNLQDEDTLKKVMATHRALSEPRPLARDGVSDGN